MARSDQSPEDQADEIIRRNKRLQQQQQRDDLVDARVRFRNQALAHGIPSTWLPSVSQVKSMDDSTWNFHNQRINRLGFYGVDDMGRPIAKPAQSPLIPASASPIRRTGGPLDDLSLNRFSTTAADAKNIAARYGGKSSIPEGGSAGYYDSKGNFLSPAYDEGGKLIPMPAGATGIKGGAAPPAVLKNSNGDVVGTKSPLDAINNPPSIASSPLPKLSTELLGVPSGRDVPSATPNAWATQTNPRIPGYANAPATPGRDIFDVASDVFGSGKTAANRVYTAVTTPETVSQNPIAPRPAGGDAVQAGVSNASAAQFEKPTKENPVPVTPTTPVKDIDKTTESLGRFGISDDEYNRRQNSFAGF